MEIESTNRLLDYKDYLKYSDTWIETGSGHGGGIQRALDAGFQHVYSMDASETSFEICKNRFFSRANNPKVHLFMGLSQRLLPQILNLAGKRCVILLDAHPSGPNSYGHAELMAGNASYAQDSIICGELEAVLSSGYEHAILFDDINGHQSSSESYAQMILNTYPGYRFSFYDENLSGVWLYKEKLLAALP